MNPPPKPELDFLQPASSPLTQSLGLGRMWEAIYAQLSAAERGALGSVHVGAADRSDDFVPFAYTNQGEDRVNLTLELKPGQLELNLVGWKEAQSDALKAWLQSVRGEDAINDLEGYEVVAFAREAYKKTPESAPWWQAESVFELGSCPAREFNAGRVAGWMIKLPGSRKQVKPAFHVRRSWPRESALQLDEGLVVELAREVRRLLPILREIWARS